MRNCKSEHSLLSPIYAKIRYITQSLNALPDKVYDRSIDLASSIANKIHECGDVVRGKQENNTSGITSVRESHFYFLESLRKENKDLYQKLVGLANATRALDENEKIYAISLFVKTHSK